VGNSHIRIGLFFRAKSDVWSLQHVSQLIWDLKLLSYRVLLFQTYQIGLFYVRDLIHGACNTSAMLQCVAVCCSVLQCAAVCCSVLQCVAVCCSVLQCAAVCCSVLQSVAVCCSLLQCAAVCCSVLQSAAVCCSVLHCVAVCCVLPTTRQPSRMSL